MSQSRFKLLIPAIPLAKADLLHRRLTAALSLMWQTKPDTPYWNVTPDRSVPISHLII